jgi:hypothetical protein
MDLTKILSISGKQGLFKVVSQLKNAVLVESLIDGKRFPAFANEKISALEEIAVFTTGEDMQLKDVLKKIHEKTEGKPGPDARSEDKTLDTFFLDAIPEYDQERVYHSDIRKIISWYNLLLEHDLLDFTEKEEEKKEGSKSDAASEAEVTPEKPVSKKKKTGKENTGFSGKPVKAKSSGRSQQSKKTEK